MILEDPQTQALWDKALGLTGQLTSQACIASGIGTMRNLDMMPSQTKATIAAAGIQACGTIFAALVEAEMLRQLHEAREAQRDQNDVR